MPLSQLEPVGEVDDDTHEAILDWHYWYRAGLPVLIWHLLLSRIVAPV